MCGKKAHTDTQTDTHTRTHRAREKKKLSSQLLFVSLKVKITDFLATLNNNKYDDNNNMDISLVH